jgi:hypothetical protein
MKLAYIPYQSSNIVRFSLNRIKSAVWPCHSTGLHAAAAATWDGKSLISVGLNKIENGAFLGDLRIYILHLEPRSNLGFLFIGHFAVRGGQILY